MSLDIQSASEAITQASAAKKISESAAQNIQIWLTDDRYENYRSQLIDHIANEQWQKLDDVFWTIIPFGTGGRRGRMYPIGSNAINDRTIGESAQGLADYVREVKPGGPWSIAIAYDTRHRSREFAELCAGIMVSNGFAVYFIDDYRSTPELSFLIRYKKCDCGIMVTASHNPPSDNAVKVYWSNGAQLIPPHDRNVIAKVNDVGKITVADFDKAVADSKVVFCREETDAALLQEHLKQSLGEARDLKIIYSPLHGVGEFNVKALLNGVGFSDLEIYERHRQPSGDFPNVPGHVSNPENAAVFDEIIEHAKQTNAELILASDPDCDRMGAAAPKTTDPRGEWGTFNGNQLSALLCEYVLRKRSENGSLTADNYVVTTLVTTKLLSRICQQFNVRCLDNNLVGFKWICNVMDQEGPDEFVYGTEESHGFLVGQYCRDKDGAVACMMMSELAADVKARGISLFEHLDNIYRQYGFHGERLITIQMEGSDGMRRMQDLMNSLRANPPKSLGGLSVTQIRDYKTGQIVRNGVASPLDGPQDNLIFIETDVEGNYVAARPSGTEPKVKFYMFTYEGPEAIEDIGQTRERMTQRLESFAVDLQAIADTIA
ncbi:MAG: phospho-sugar mutase [Pirellulaceae bacterium]